MSLITVDKALAEILKDVTPCAVEDVSIGQASGRTLARDITSLTDQPPFDASAMDGYAVRAADCSHPGATLNVIGEAAAGRAFEAALTAGDAIRIFTGAPVPAGADTIVIQENTERTGERVTITVPPAAHANIRPRAQDLTRDGIVLRAGTRLTARHILLAAAAGHGVVSCIRQPRISILCTGDELVEPGETLTVGQIFASNGYGLATMIDGFGGDATRLPIARDTRESLAARLAEAADADILVTVGGASVGDHDIVRDVLQAHGAELAFYKIAMRPGKPVFFGARNRVSGPQRILGLPGNPVSAMVAARVFLVPLLCAMLGLRDAPANVRAALREALPANGPRTHYMRASLHETDTGFVVSPAGSQDSSMVRILAEANALIVVPANAPAMSAGQLVDVMRLDF